MTDWNAVIRATADPRAKKKPDAAIIGMIADHADDQFPTWGFTTIRRKAALLAHICVETANFTALEENLNYSAERLHEVWRKRFPTVESATPFAHNPRALANKVYGGRMGNRAGTDDGWLNRGKGLLQSTGHDNAGELGKKLGVSPEVASAWLIHPDHALECACTLFVLLGALPAADSGDVVAQTKRINGGRNGLAERQAAYARAMRALSLETAKARVEAPQDDAEPTETPPSVGELRAAGSRTIKGADQAQQGVAGAMVSVAGASAALSQIKDVADQAQEAATAVQSGVSALEALRDYWPLLGVVGLSAAAAYFVWRAWRGASLVKAARVDDAASGLNIGR
ncbi:putative chitinase [Methylosinus sp. sav-2]|uniref:glycoside hydrolase family 19 protein n=1 Tax=Methylosinus sp. sav-2 TaxID=2485168 RepID=UPI0006923510|nr:glycoside hydrolase family 19 protein [Methylosinus sp. sav-2]TDX63985.1 putative chitinase [Methylosinus sp. sav-2]